ncbi:MAG: galactokinase, partial [Patescibacteria group bacterium]
FKEYYGAEPEVAVNSPGRAEIIGNHTDYNLGYALGCAISKSTIGLFKKREDRKIIARTTMAGFESEAIEFSLDKIERDETVKWGNYVRGVARELLTAHEPIGGAEILVDTNFSTSGGMSSSAALELCIAYGLMSLAGQKIESEAMAWRCKKGENSDLVQSPCGFLDQGVIAFAQKDKMVFLDFQEPVKVKLIKADLARHKVSLVVVVDKTVKRILGESGYPARKKSCELACGKLKIKSLRELSGKDFEGKKGVLDLVTRKRVEHIVYENERVLAAVKALAADDMNKFGRLLSESGKSALDLYDLAENTPELRYLMEAAQRLDGVLGARNMGGGFSAIILALVKDEKMKEFEKELKTKYQEKFGEKLEMVKFEVSQGTEVFTNW